MQIKEFTRVICVEGLHFSAFHCDCSLGSPGSGGSLGSPCSGGSLGSHGSRGSLGSPGYGCSLGSPGYGDSLGSPYFDVRFSWFCCSLGYLGLAVLLVLTVP